jgi:hypothetical protein
MKDIKMNASGSAKIPAYLVVFLIIMSAFLCNLLGIWLVLSVGGYPGSILGSIIIIGTFTLLFRTRKYLK